jgi:hypothetical protein
MSQHDYSRRCEWASAINHDHKLPEGLIKIDPQDQDAQATSNVISSVHHSKVTKARTIVETIISDNQPLPHPENSTQELALPSVI